MKHIRFCTAKKSEATKRKYDTKLNRKTCHNFKNKGYFLI